MTAALEGEDAYVANAWHESVELSPSERKLFPRMDGALDRSGLIQLLVDSAGSGDGGDLESISEEVDAMMRRLRQMAVLERDPVHPLD